MSEEIYHSTIANENINISQVTKRDGTLAPFDSNKIYQAILKAGTSTNEFGSNEAWLLTGQVLKVMKHKYAETLPTIENIQDISRIERLYTYTDKIKQKYYTKDKIVK